MYSNAVGLLKKTGKVLLDDGVAVSRLEDSERLDVERHFCIVELSRCAGPRRNKLTHEEVVVAKIDLHDRDHERSSGPTIVQLCRMKL